MLSVDAWDEALGGFAVVVVVGAECAAERCLFDVDAVEERGGDGDEDYGER